MFRRIVTGTIIIMLLMFFAFILPYPYRVNTTLSGIRWASGNEALLEHVDIKVKGLYLRYLIRDNSFTGTISISGIDNTSANSLCKFVISKNTGFGPLLNFHNSIIDDLGLISVTGTFKNIVIHLTTKKTGQVSEEYISAPATDRNSAVDLASRIYGKDYQLK